MIQVLFWRIIKGLNTLHLSPKIFLSTKCTPGNKTLLSLIYLVDGSAQNFSDKQDVSQLRHEAIFLALTQGLSSRRSIENVIPLDLSWSFCHTKRPQKKTLHSVIPTLGNSGKHCSAWKQKILTLELYIYFHKQLLHTRIETFHRINWCKKVCHKREQCSGDSCKMSP